VGSHGNIRTRLGVWWCVPVLLSVVGLEADTVVIRNIGNCAVNINIYNDAGGCTQGGFNLGPQPIASGASFNFSTTGPKFLKQDSGAAILGQTCWTVGQASIGEVQIWKDGCDSTNWFVAPKIINNSAFDVEIGVAVGNEDLGTDVFLSGSSILYGSLGPYSGRSNVIAYMMETGLGYDFASGEVSQVTRSNVIASAGATSPPWSGTSGGAQSTPFVITIGNAPISPLNPTGTNNPAYTGTNLLTGNGNVNPTNGAPLGGGGPPSVATEAFNTGGIIDAINNSAQKAHADELLALKQLQLVNTNLGDGFSLTGGKLTGATNLLGDAVGVLRGLTNMFGGDTNGVDLSGITGYLARANEIGTGGTNILTGMSNLLARLVDTNGWVTNAIGATNLISGPVSDLNSLKEGALATFVHWDTPIGASPFSTVTIGSGTVAVEADTNPFNIPVIATGAAATRRLAAFFLVVAFFGWAFHLVWDEIAKGLRTPNVSVNSQGGVPVVGGLMGSLAGAAIVLVASTGLVALFAIIYAGCGLDELLTGPWSGLGAALWVMDQLFPVYLSMCLVFTGLVLTITAGFWKVLITYTAKVVSP